MMFTCPILITVPVAMETLYNMLQVTIPNWFELLIRDYNTNKILVFNMMVVKD